MKRNTLVMFTIALLLGIGYVLVNFHEEKKPNADVQQEVKPVEKQAPKVDLKKNDKKNISFEDYVKMGKASYSKQDYKTALGHFEQAQKLSPDDVTVNYGLAECYYQQKDFQSAKFHYKRVLELDKEKNLAYFGLADSAFSLGEYKNAVKNYEKALSYKTVPKEIREHYIPVYQRMKMLVTYSGEYLTPTAFEKYDDAFDKSLASFKSNKSEAAIVQGKKALEIIPNSYESLCLLGAIYTRDRKYNDAKSYYEKAVKVAPSEYSTYALLASMYLQKGSKPQAIKNYQMVIDSPSAPADIKKQCQEIINGLSAKGAK